MFHAPATNIFWIMGACVFLYLGDWLGYFVGTFYCPTLMMTPLGESAVEIVFEHPRGFVNHGGNYVYLCLPWLGKAEWHAFSLYAHPTLENHSSVCVAKLGDWTGALHRAVPVPTARPGCTDLTRRRSAAPPKPKAWSAWRAASASRRRWAPSGFWRGRVG